MQVQKENIRKLILNTARNEFIQKGFKDASMRDIAKKSAVTLSNIYNYFKNKDEIFCEVMSPLLKAFDKLLKEHNSEDYLTTDIFSMKSYQHKMIRDFMLLLKDYGAELKMLLFHANGSSLENFRDTFTDRQTETGIEYVQLMKQKYPQVHTDISYFFMHTMSSWWLTILGEIISHDELSEKQIKQFLSEYVAFGTAGWKKLMKV